MNIDELVVRGTGNTEREPSAQEIQQAIDNDPEGILITHYLTNSLSPEEHAEVERRLREDEAFRARAEPLIAAWEAWPTAREFTVSDEERDASFKHFLVKWGAHERARQEDDQRRETPVRLADDEPRAADVGAHRRQLRRWQLAAALLMITTLGGFPLASWWGYTRAEKRRPPATYIVEADTRETQSLMVGGKVAVSLSVGSRLTWSEKPGINGAIYMYLDGEAQVTAFTSEPGKYIIVTPSGRLNLDGATALVDATDPVVTRVQVSKGIVIVESRSNQNHPLLILRAGEKGRAIHNQEPRRIQ